MEQKNRVFSNIYDLCILDNTHSLIFDKKNSVDMPEIIKTTNIFKKMFNQCPTIDLVGSYTSSLIHYTNNVEDVKLLLDNDIKLHFTYDVPRTIAHPLLYHLGNVEILDLLLEYKDEYKLFDVHDKYKDEHYAPFSLCGKEIKYDFKDLLYNAKTVDTLKVLKKHDLLRNISIEEYLKKTTAGNINFSIIKYLVEQTHATYHIDYLIDLYNRKYKKVLSLLSCIPGHYRKDENNIPDLVIKNDLYSKNYDYDYYEISEFDQDCLNKIDEYRFNKLFYPTSTMHSDIYAKCFEAQINKIIGYFKHIEKMKKQCAMFF